LRVSTIDFVLYSRYTPVSGEGGKRCCTYSAKAGECLPSMPVVSPESVTLFFVGLPAPESLIAFDFP
jgi:hypothetical protein